MASFEQYVDDAEKDNTIDALCFNYKRPDKVTGLQGLPVDNPVSKEEFANNVICSFLMENRRAYAGNLAAEQARIAAIKDIDNAVVFAPTADKLTALKLANTSLEKA